MNLLEIFFILSGMIIFILALDVAKKQKFNALHFIVFIGVAVCLFVFSFFPNSLNYIGRIFGLQRGADLMVYMSIIFLLYFTLLLLKKIEQTKEDLTKLIREIAIYNSPKKIFEGEMVFLVRVYNEGKIIEKTINEILKEQKNILVINDGSIDNSLSTLEKFGDKIVVLNHLKNRGAGAALETGFEYLRRYSKAKYVCTFDADGQLQLKDLPKFMEQFKKDKSLDVVLGSRFITKTNTNVGIVRKIVLKAGMIFTFFVSNIKLSDAHNGYRVFKTQVLNEIKLTMDSYAYASELIDIISSKKIKFKEVPVDILHTEYSMSKGQKSSNLINTGFKVLRYKFFK